MESTRYNILNRYKVRGQNTKDLTAQSRRNRRNRDRQAIRDFLKRYGYTHSLVLEFPAIETTPGIHRRLMFGNERDHELGDLCVRKWRQNRLPRLLLGRHYKRYPERQETLFDGVPLAVFAEPTPGRGWLHYHILARIPSQHIEQLTRRAKKSWSAVIAANCFCYRSDPGEWDQTFEYLYDCGPIYDERGAIQYDSKKLPRIFDIAYSTERIARDSFTLL